MNSTGTVGKWLAAAGPESDVVLSTRVRLARNLAEVPFTHRSKADAQERTVEAVRLALTDSGYIAAGEFIDNERLSEQYGQYLVERHLASPDFTASKAKRGLYFSEDEATSLMVNEEDHLRFQVLASGLDFPEAFTAAATLDEKLEGQLQYAFSPEFGFLTACPTNLGTGMRASVLVHLPALVITREIEKVLRGALQIGLAVRGLYGEGTETKGNFFQISNQKTVGQTEWEIIETIADISRQIIQYERKARGYLMNKLRVEIEDKVFRSLGLLRGARILTSDEAINLIANLRLGIALGIVNELNLEQVTRLMVLVRPANLQAMLGENLTASERDERRATFVRETLVHQ
ncbi:MAG TPA: protein arginine kinase [bacterium]|nr:protein arginine kinase [bacterium]